MHQSLPILDGWYSGHGGYITIGDRDWQVDKWGVRLKNPDIQGEITLLAELPLDSLSVLQCSAVLVDVFDCMLVGTLEIVEQRAGYPVYKVLAVGDWKRQKPETIESLLG